MIREETVITNRLGLHARAAAKLVQVANQYDSKVIISTGTISADAKSILGVLTLAAGKDTVLSFEFTGADESEAASAVLKLIEDRFGED